MVTTYRFQEHRQSRSALVHCPTCGKKRRLSVSRSYYDNGFHNVSDTRAKNWEAIDAELARLQVKGSECGACYDIRENRPVIKKLSKDLIAVYDRATGVELGQAERKWRDWYIVGWTRWGYPARDKTQSGVAEMLQRPGDYHMVKVEAVQA